MSSVPVLGRQKYQFAYSWTFSVPWIRKKWRFWPFSSLNNLECVECTGNLHILVKMRGQWALCDHYILKYGNLPVMGPFGPPGLENSGDFNPFSSLNNLRCVKCTGNLHILVKMRGQWALCEHYILKHGNLPVFGPFRPPELEKSGDFNLFSSLNNLECVKFTGNVHILVKMRGQ